jgi:hypothetical protein
VRFTQGDSPASGGGRLAYIGTMKCGQVDVKRSSANFSAVSIRLELQALL